MYSYTFTLKYNNYSKGITDTRHEGYVVLCEIFLCFYSKTNYMHQFLKFILFWKNTLHVSDGLSVHHQEFKTVHTATGICQTGIAACLLAALASRLQYLFDIYLLLYVQS